MKYAHNDGFGESSVLQNEFTAYLIIAIRRHKWRYLLYMGSRQNYELPLDMIEHTPALWSESDMLDMMPVLAQLDDSRLLYALQRQKERNLYILFSKAVSGRTFVEIAAELGMDYNAVAAVYYRLITRLKRELGVDSK